MIKNKKHAKVISIICDMHYLVLTKHLLSFSDKEKHKEMVRDIVKRIKNLYDKCNVLLWATKDGV